MLPSSRWTRRPGNEAATGLNSGRNGTHRSPAAMSRLRLSGKVGAGLDTCAVLQVPFELEPGQERELVFMLGVGRDVDDARDLVQRFRGASVARGALDAVWQYWNHTLGAVQVQTPDQSLNVLTNGWLVYQTLACRLWARAATTSREAPSVSGISCRT